MSPAKKTRLEVLAVYMRPHILAILMLGVASGLPLALSFSTLTAWLSDAGIDKKAIGLFAALGLPYSFKFAWAPLIDRLPLPVFTRRLGRRRSWAILLQAGLATTMAAIAFLDPAVEPWLIALGTLILAILSASQDIVLDAYRVERSTKEEIGPATSMFTLGYRIGMLVSGAGALYIADSMGWQVAYLAMAAVMAGTILITLLVKEPDVPLPAPLQGNTRAERVANWMKTAVVAPFAQFITNEKWLLILLFIALYKLGDAMLGAMTNPFLLEIGFTKTDIALIVKTYGLPATIFGTFLGGAMTQRWGAYKPLVICGFLHALTNLMFLLQAQVGADPLILAIGICVENLTGGASLAALVVYISLLCNARFTATQFALLSSLAALGRTLLSTSSGVFVEWLGWSGFFLFCVALAFPSLILLKFLPKEKAQSHSSASSSL